MKSNVVTVLNIPLRERNNTFDMNDKLDNIRVQLNVYVVQLEVFQFFLYFLYEFHIVSILSRINPDFSF